MELVYERENSFPARAKSRILSTGEDLVRAVRDSLAPRLDVEPEFRTTIAPDLVTYSLWATFRSGNSDMIVEAPYGHWLCSASKWPR